MEQVINDEKALKVDAVDVVEVIVEERRPADSKLMIGTGASRKSNVVAEDRTMKLSGGASRGERRPLERVVRRL